MLRIKRHLFTAFGFMFLAIAVLGFIFPLLPGTPFLILAAYCLSKGSNRFHDWLISHRWFGPPIRNWREHHAIALRHKVTATGMMAISCAALFTRPQLPPAAKAGFGIFVVCLMAAIWSRKSR